MWPMVLGFVVAIAVWAAAHYYVGWRLVGPFKSAVGWKFFVWALLLGHIVVGIVGMSARLIDDTGVFGVVQWVNYIGMGAFTLLLTLMVIKDLGWFVAQAIIRYGNRTTGRAPVGAGDVADPNRRQFMSNVLNAGVVTAASVGTKYGFYEARRTPNIVEVSVPIAGLHRDLDGFRIVQISDLHVGPTIKKNIVEAVVEAVNALEPDMVAITGDLIDGFVPRLWNDVEPLTQIISRHGTYFCTGNHEYYWDPQGWCDVLETNGIRVLNNAHTIVSHGQGRLLIGGCTDHSAARMLPDHASDPVAAKAGADAHHASVLLAHQPKSIFGAAKAGFDLQLSGHTHGGQFWPWNYVVGLVHPFSVGLDRFEDTWIYVSRGTGYWGPPMRIAAPSEITVLRLAAA